MGKLVSCKTCGNQVDNTAKACPHCGVKSPGISGKQKWLRFLMYSMATVFVIMLMAKGSQKGTTMAMQGVTNQVANDMVEQYNIAKQQGDKIQTCVQAGIVSAAYLQAKDQPNYNQWKATQKQDCRKAGVPMG